MSEEYIRIQDSIKRSMCKPTVQRILRLILTLSICLSWSVFSEAQTLYRYRDANGTLVLSNSIPADIAKKNGYQIVDKFGRVVKEVPPAPTEQELAEIKRKREEEARLAAIAKKQAEEDEQLLRLYSHPDDAIRARDRKLQDIEVLTRQKTASLKAIESKILELESQAANAERTGKQVPERVLNELSVQQTYKERTISDLRNYETTRQQIEIDFEAKIARLRILMKRR